MTRKPPSKKLPTFIEPMLAVMSPPFESSRHAYEIKWDGFRSLCFVEARGIRLVGRRTTDFTERFPELVAPLSKLPKGTVLDGEIVHLKDGRPDFAALLSRERSWSGASPANRNPRKHAPVTFVAFDVLYEKFASVMDEPLVARRKRLTRLLAKHIGPRVAISESSTGNGLALFEQASKLGLEGVIAKRLDGPYEPGRRSGSWVKFKRRQSIVCLILGYEPSSSGGIKSLIIASDINGELRCVGQVGSGIDDAMSTQLLRQFREMGAPAPVVPCNIRRGRWIRPTLFCRVSFAEWTDGGKLRAPVFESMYAAGRPTPLDDRSAAPAASRRRVAP